MYYPNAIEDICFEPDHIDRVLAEIRANFPDYFEKYIETVGGRIVTEDKIETLAQMLGATSVPQKKRVDGSKVLDTIKQEAIDRFEKDREKYVAILSKEAMEEYGYDPASFKNTILRNQCPVIHKTLKNVKAKELDRYREAFNMADPRQLFEVVDNLANFGRDYVSHKYAHDTFEQCNSLEEMGFRELWTDKYSLHGVIGGGIKSHLLYKLYPHVFPYRSQESIWALWYLTGKKSFGCKQDSEFLMISQQDVTTQQNYFYPYFLFAYYALNLYNIILKEYSKRKLPLPVEHRFVFVDDFLSYVASCHSDEIETLKRQAKDNWHGY